MCWYISLATDVNTTKAEKIPTDFTVRHMPQANADLFPLVPKLVLHKYVYFSGENPAFTSPSFFLLVLSELKTVRVFQLKPT